MKRIFPEGINFDEKEYANYVTSFRNKLAEISDVNAEKLKKEGWYQSNPNVEHKIVEEEIINENLAKIKAIITFNDRLGYTVNQSKNKVKYMFATRIEINVNQYYIKSEGYWFPYDYMPNFKVDN